MGSSRRDLQRAAAEVRQIAGAELFEVQKGKSPSDFKPMASVGPGVCEIRIRTGVAHRMLYIARFDEAVYVLHFFEKRSRKTAPSDIQLARKRLAEVNLCRHEEGRQ